MRNSKKHKSHIKGRRAKHRPFGKYPKFSKSEELAWLKQKEKEDLSTSRQNIDSKEVT